jgi:hypothetical protein
MQETNVFQYIDIKPIILNIESNSPKMKPFQFQKGNLSIAKDTVNIPISGGSQNPYFTRDIEYPFEILSPLEYSEQLEFFFDLNKFKEILFKSPEFQNIIKQKKEMEELKQKINNDKSVTLKDLKISEAKLKEYRKEKGNLIQQIAIMNEYIDDWKADENIDITTKMNNDINVIINDISTIDTNILDEYNKSYSKFYGKDIEDFAKKPFTNMKFILEKIKLLNGEIKTLENKLNNKSSDTHSQDIQINMNKLKYLRESLEENKKANEQKNIKIMCLILFPTSFPLPGNIQFSFDSYIKKSPIFIDYSHYEGYYSYLLVGSKYTILRTTWLNDFLNNPDFKDFVLVLKNYIKWIEKQKKENEITDSIYEIIKKMKKTNIFETIPKIMKNVQEEMNDSKIKSSTITSINNDLNKLLKDNDSLKILFFSSFDENFDKIRKLYNTIYEKISTLKTIINRIPYFYDYDFKDIDKSLKEIKSINKNIEKVRITQGIDKYLINLYKLTDKTNQNKRRSYEDEEEEDENRKEEKDERQEIYAIQQEIRKKYGNNNFFNNNIKQLAKILKQNESISNKSLQKEIKTQLENLSSLTPFFEKIDKLNIYPGDYDFLYTGLSKNVNKNEKYLNEDEDEEEEEEEDKKNKAQKEEEEIDSYSIYLFMDLIQGQMNNKNKKEIECEYRNESLGKTFMNLTSNVFKNKYLIENYTYPYLSLGGLQEETKKKLNSLQKTQKVKNKKPKKQTTQKQQPTI